MTWNVIGQALATVWNQLLAWAWALLHLPLLAPPSAEFIASEQMLAGMLLWLWATKEKLPLPALQEGAKP